MALFVNRTKLMNRCVHRPIAPGIEIRLLDYDYLVRLQTVALKTMAVGGLVIKLADIKHTAIG